MEDKDMVWSLQRCKVNTNVGICLDMSPDVSTGNPAVAAFTLEGQEFVSNKYNGVGSSQAPNGIVSSPVAGSKLIVTGLN